MNKFYSSPATTPRFTEPETLFVRFVDENYSKNYPLESRSLIKFLELGSGSGADLKFLERRKFDAIGIDSGQFSYAHFHCDFSAFPWGQYKEYFDCIYDLNVLCCVKEPPYREIADSLRRGGKFFSITPATGTMADYSHLEYVRRSTPFSIRTVLSDFFSKIEIEEYRYPHRRRSHINWVVEAEK